MRKFLLLFIFCSQLFISCKKQNNCEIATKSIQLSDIEKHVKNLASDKFMGRKPFSTGEKLTLDYLENQFKKIGLKAPVNGKYIQEVPMVEIKMNPSEKMIITKDGSRLELNYQTEFVAFSRKIEKESFIQNSDIIFAGYGIVAPEYNWNDYANIDVKGKIVVVLVNDPGFGTEDKSFFKANEMTYYGRWVYKYEEAARQGARGCIIIHETKAAGYPFSVVRNGAVIPKLYLQDKDGYKNRCDLEGWITLDAARKLFEFTKTDWSVIDKAKVSDFKAFDMNARINLDIKKSFKYNKSYNIMGLLEGTDLKDEVIIYSAHWDHLGIGPKLNGDSIYNGAVDNGTSLAWMLEIAEAFTKLEKKPRRSILFLAPTAEEQGILGSLYYVQNPVFPLSKTVANINNDLMLPYGRMKDIMVTGYGQSELDDYVNKLAKKQDRYVLPDPNPHTGMYFRSDHFRFAQYGIPSLFVRGNCDSREKGKEWMAKKEKEWLSNNYHKPQDQYENWWNLEGVVEDSKLLFELGYILSNESKFPKWNSNSEFKKIRDLQFN
ncbi:MAG: M28 family metallopeptidase [Marinifilaceae bacterium]|jgi:Zn-dependent M28 family amino/carboxypeptidase|nr:M28 family metallopeptidase [Marinifilaceae bacterium]